MEPAGPWNGQEVEVVSNPTRHDVMLVRCQTWLWYRDRLLAARNNLERTQGAAAVRSTVIGL